MQKMNILFASKNPDDYLEYLRESKYAEKIYITSQKEYPRVTTVYFNTFQELAEKCKALKIDLVIVEEQKWILQGIGDVLKKYFINSTAADSYWTNLALSNSFAREMCTKYGINIPNIIRVPLDFPIIIKADGITEKADDLQEAVEIRKSLNDISPEISKTVFIEQFVTGEKYKVTSVYDGKNLITLPAENSNPDLLGEYTEKLKQMFLSEKANFVGTINSDLIESNGKLYNVGFSFEFLKQNLEYDIFYILTMAIYQKLDEVVLNKS